MESSRRDAQSSPESTRISLPPIPDGAGAFALGSFRQADLREAVAPLWQMVSADVRPILEAAEKAIVGMTTPEFRDEVFRHLGPTWCMYAAAGARPDSDGSADPAFLVEVDDSEAAAKLLDELVSRANVYFREQRPGDGPAAMSFERLPSAGARLSPDFAGGCGSMAKRSTSTDCSSGQVVRRSGREPRSGPGCDRR